MRIHYSYYLQEGLYLTNDQNRVSRYDLAKNLKEKTENLRLLLRNCYISLPTDLSRRSNCNTHGIDKKLLGTSVKFVNNSISLFLGNNKEAIKLSAENLEQGLIDLNTQITKVFNGEIEPKALWKDEGEISDEDSEIIKTVIIRGIRNEFKGVLYPGLSK